MAFKDIIIPVFNVAQDEPALKAAEIVGDLADGHLTAVFLELEPDPVVAADGFIWGEIWDRIAEGLVEDARAASLALQQRPWSRRVAMRELRTRPSALGNDIAQILRCADLTVVNRLGNEADSTIRSEVFEAALFKSGRPVLLAPPGWRGGIGRRVFVAWSGSRESARALADAVPFIESADHVTVATIADQHHRTPISGEAVAGHLAHHGVKSELKVLPLSRGDELATLLEAASAVCADLIVMGGYGHARAAEFIFGGMTRTLSRISPIPLLMAH